VVSISLALWSANNATKGLFRALTIVYDEEERRGFVKLNFETLCTTLFLVGASRVLIVLVALVPLGLRLVCLEASSAAVIGALRWPVAIVLLMVGLAVLYRIGPAGGG